MDSIAEVKERAQKLIRDLAIDKYENEKKGDNQKAKFYEDAIFGASLVAWYACGIDLSESGKIENEVRKTFYPEKLKGLEYSVILDPDELGKYL